MDTTLQIPDVDPVEKLLVVVGVEAIASREVEKLRAADVDRFENFSKAVLNRCRAMVAGDLPRFRVADYEHAKLLKDLTRPWDEDQLLQTVEGLPPEFDPLIPLFVQRSQQLVEQLRDAIPRVVSNSILGISSYEPSKAAAHEFGEVLEVLIDPLRVVDRMAVGALLKSQVQAVRQYYPSVSAAIDLAIVEAVGAQAVTKDGARDQSFFLDRATESGINRWYGDPATSPFLAKALQASFSKGDQPQPRKPDQRTSPIAKEVATPAQRTELREASR